MLITITALVPLVGALLMTVLRGGAARGVALVASLVPLVLALLMAAQFTPGDGFQFTAQTLWIPAINAYYAVGLDGIGLSMLILTGILTPLVVAYSFTEHYREDQYGEAAFLGFVLAIEGLSVFVFTATDVLLFYLFFEATLIPMFFLIGGFGGERRRYAAIKFLLYSLASGLIMLAAVIGVYVVSQQGNDAGTFLLRDLMATPIAGSTGRWLFAGFMIAFIVKAPMVPLHTWLPDAAENTTPGGAIMMVAIMDKIGTFGMIRFALGLFPEASAWATQFMIILAVVSVLWGAFAALAQTDLMRFVAYTSVSHFGFIVLGIFAFTPTSFAGSALYMFNHGLSTAALFFVVGYLIRRRGTGDIFAFGGVQQVAPLLAGFLLIAGLSALSLPGLAPFISEFAVIAGTFTVHPWAAGIAAIAMVLSAVYVTRIYRVTMTGQPSSVIISEVPEITQSERWILAPVIALLIFFGLFPAPITSLVNPDAEAAVTAVVSTARVQGSDVAAGAAGTTTEGGAR
ncbi:MAG: NADH-quinone oxidoreductase subunit M [Corynebacterium sp.]|nr:NADH-quinone oxidoreductase subunit M [Corynebacterium sp.]